MGRFFFFQKATNNLDKDSCGEILDNRWLKKEVHLTAGLNWKRSVGTKFKFKTERSLYTDVVCQSTSTQAKRARENELRCASGQLSPAVFIFIPALDDLYSENRGSANRLNWTFTGSIVVNSNLAYISLVFLLLAEFIFLQLGFSMHEIVQAALRFYHVRVSLVHGKKHTEKKPPLH